MTYEDMPVSDIAKTMVSMMEVLTNDCHQASYDAGWWHHAATGYPYIPGDSARASDQDGNPVVIPWNQLPPLARQMVNHYWPILIGCKIGLVHSEMSESMEAHRKSLFDDKLKHRLGIAAEISDAMIRQFDLAGAMERAAALGVVNPETHSIELGKTILEKMAFNAVRPDHKIAARRAAGGKYY